ncbi:MAG: hypothetical protein IKM66_11040 [Clostridia bacterium]|nr:hypothetical protein [Clostridia bacterium]
MNKNDITLAERYFEYARKHQQDFNKRRIEIEKLEARRKNKKVYEQRLLNNQELAKKLKGKYNYALMAIKPEYRTCELVDMNLCFRSLTDNTLDFLSPAHFDNDVLNDRMEYADTNYESCQNNNNLYFDSLEANEEYKKNGTLTYYLVPPDDESYDDNHKKEKRENLSIKKSYIQYKIIKEYLTLEKKIKKYENLIELCEKIPTLYDRPIQNINTDHVMNIFLYGLTNGDLNKFYELARFCAKIKDTKSRNKAFAIYANPTIYDALVLFIGASTYKLLQPCSFKSMWKKQVLLDLQKASMNNINTGYVCIDEPIPDTVAKVKTLKKIMKGNIITVKDKYYPVDLRIINRIPMIYITQNIEQFKKMKNIFSATAIEFHSKDIAMPNISPQALYWLQNDFISLGMHNIREVEKYPPKPDRVTEDDIIEDFIESVCILGDDFNCPIQELYSAYCEFYKKYYGNNHLTQIKFTKQFAVVTNLQKYRPHYKGQSNVYYFKGIKIDETKINPHPVKEETVKDDVEKKQKNESDSAKKYPTTFEDFCKDITSKQFRLYQDQLENIRIFNYQQNMEE